MATKWVYRVSDGVWQVGPSGTPEAIHTTPSAYRECELAQEMAPDPRLERYNVLTPSVPRAATAQEIAAYDAVQDEARARRELFNRREMTALFWLLIERTSPPATTEKLRLLREQLVGHYVTQPWKTS